MNMKRLLLILIAIAGCLGYACAASPDAAAILAKMKAKINASPSLEAVFTINGGEGPVEGNAVIAGSKYTMQTPQLRVWFDGRTQWTYLLNTGEVSITEPDASEQMASNPFAILSAHSDYYKSKRLSDSQGRYRVLLTPVGSASGIEKITLFINVGHRYKFRRWKKHRSSNRQNKHRSGKAGLGLPLRPCQIPHSTRNNRPSLTF